MCKIRKKRKVEKTGSMAQNGGFLMDGDTIIGVDKSAKELRVPEGTVKVAKGAFDGAAAEYFDMTAATGEVFAFVKANLPGSVRVLRMSPLNPRWMAGVHALDLYKNMANVEYVEVPESHAECKSIDGLVYTKDGKRLLFCPPGRTGHVEVEKGTEKMSGHVFHQTKVTSVGLPEGITLIGFCAVSGTNIQEISIPASIQQIEHGNFDGTKVVHLKGGKPIKGLWGCLTTGNESERGWRALAGPYTVLDMAGYSFAFPAYIEWKRTYPFLDSWKKREFSQKEASAFFHAAALPEDRQDAALAQHLLNPGEPYAAKFLIRHACEMAERYIKTGDIQRLINLARTGLLKSERLSKPIQETIRRTESTEGRAILLEALKKTGQAKSQDNTLKL